MNLTFRVNKPIDTVFDYLTDIQKFVSVHPLISKIDDLSGNNYLVHETLKVGFIPFSFTYPVKIEQSFQEKKVIIRAIIMKLTKIEMTYQLASDNNLTVIEEVITFKSILPIKSIMESIFRKQHTLLFEKMEALT